jgi:hypothetical protein
MRDAPLVVDLLVELRVDMVESRVEMVESRVEMVESRVEMVESQIELVESMVLGVGPSLRRLFLARAACP